jgi:hypothetical protein
MWNHCNEGGPRTQTGACAGRCFVATHVPMNERSKADLVPYDGKEILRVA